MMTTDGPQGLELTQTRRRFGNRARTFRRVWLVNFLRLRFQFVHSAAQATLAQLLTDK